MIGKSFVCRMGGRIYLYAVHSQNAARQSGFCFVGVGSGVVLGCFAQPERGLKPVGQGGFAGSGERAVTVLQ